MDSKKKGNGFQAGGEILESALFVSRHSELLKTLPLFAGVPFDLLEPFFRQCEYRRFIEKTVLLSPGQENHYLFVLLAGQLDIHIESLDSDQGFKVQPGEFVGEVSIIDGLAPTAYVEAAMDSLLLCIHETVLWNKLFQIQGTARNMFRQIAGRMRDRNAAMQKAVEQTLRLEHLEKELRIAQELQLSMLPLKPFFPNYPEVDADAFMKAAKEVGGDFYDCFPLDSNRICLAIGDVAGKGVPAALFMVRTITILRAEMLKCKDLLQTIYALNENLSADNLSCMFVTLMICVVDLADGRLHYVNGGHNKPVFGNFRDGFHFLEQPKGILLGINPNADYEMVTRNLNGGDMLILYTDGITEAMNSEQEEFTEQSLLNYIDNQAEQAVGDMITGILSTVQEFVGTAEQSDDLTLLAIHYRDS